MGTVTYLSKLPDNIRDRTGDVHNRLKVMKFLGFVSYKSGRQTLWECRCECGNIKQVTAAGFMGATKSCGCLNKELKANRARTSLKQTNTKHGLSQHALYDTWSAMMSRCENPEDKDFKTYGARGIRVCDRWRNVVNFILDVGDRPEGMTLDREDVNGDYCPENCRWALPRTQNLNTRYNVSTPNIYLMDGRYKSWFELDGVKHAVGDFSTLEEATAALEDKQLEVGWYEKERTLDIASRVVEK